MRTRTVSRGAISAAGRVLAAGLFVWMTSIPARAANEISITAPRALPQANVGAAYAYPFTATGGTPPYHWLLVRPVGSSPIGAGWALGEGGQLTGSPPAGTGPDGNPTNTYVEGFRVFVRDDHGNSGQGTFEVQVADGGAAPAVVTRSPLLPGAAGQPYLLALRAGSGTAPFTWSVAAGSTLPPGLSLAAGGLLSGTPSGAGDFSFTVALRDADARKAVASLALRIDDLGSPLRFAVDAKTVVRAATPRIGTNVGSRGEYWDDSGTTNQFVDNPGLEPKHARRMYRAWTGSANTIEEWDLVQYDAIAELQTGYWDGGKYWIQSGPAKGRSGIIQKYERVAGGGVADWRGIWTLTDSDPNRVVQTLTHSDTDFGKQDIFLVESGGTNQKNDYGVLPAPWSPYLAWGVTSDQVIVAADTAVKASGGQSARVTSTVAQEAGIWELLLWDNPLRRLRTDTRYHFSAKVRQSGVAGGQVALELGGPWGGEKITTVDATVPDDGAFHLVEGEIAGHGESQLGIYVYIAKPGTLWVDDVLFWEAQSTTTSAHAAGSDPVSAGVFQSLPYVARDLGQMLHAGTLRFWYYGTDLNFTEALGAPSAADPSSGNHTLFLDLSLAEQVGANAWIIAAKEWTPEEMVQLVEYLASPDTSQGMGKLRASQGHPDPWVKTLTHLFIEYSNEAWNWPSYAYPFDLWHPELYSSFASERFAAMKASPAFDGSAMTLVVNGQVGDDFWVNGPVEEQTQPLADALDNAPYLSPALELPWMDGGRQMVGWSRSTIDAMAGTIRLWRDKGHATRLLVYEGGPGPRLWNPPMDEEARHSSVYYAAIFLDSVADLFEHGIDCYNQFVYQNAIAWKAESGHSSRFHHPTGHALALFNQAAGDLDQVAVTASGVVPTITPLAYDAYPNDARLIDGAAVPAVTCRAYRGGDERQGLVLVNRNLEASYPVAVETGWPNRTFTVRTLAAADPMRGALEGAGLLDWGSDASKVDLAQVFEAVQPTEVTVTSDANGDLTLSLPAGGLVTASLGTPSDDPQPSTKGKACGCSGEGQAMGGAALWGLLAAAGLLRRLRRYRRPSRAIGSR